MNKKDVPLIILDALGPLLKSDSKLFRKVKSEGILEFRDYDADSDFFFVIKGWFTDKDGTYLSISYKPSTSIHTNEETFSTNPKYVKDYFNAWVGLLDKYNIAVDPFEDPLIKQYQQEFEEKFELIEDDADSISFNLEQQLYIDNYLQETILALEQHRDEKNAKEIDSIKEVVQELKETQTSLTKKKVVEKLSKIWAMARKHGLSMLKIVFTEAVKEGVKHLFLN